MRRHRSGLTLVELSMAASLMVVLLASAVSMLIVARGMYRAAAAQAEALRRVDLIASRLSTDLHDSRTTVTAIDDAIAWASPVDENGLVEVDASGKRINRRYLIYYRKDGVLRRREAVSPTYDYAEPLPADEVLALCDGTGSIVARGLTVFTIDASKYSWMATFDLEVEVTVGDQRYVEGFRHYVFRN